MDGGLRMYSYNKNYLKHVIIKANFSGIPSVDKELPENIINVVLDKFLYLNKNLIHSGN